MKRQLLSLNIFVFVTMFCILSCQKEVTTNDSLVSELGNSISESGKISKNVPFKGSYTTTAQLLSGPPMLMQRITGTGQATHLGESVFVALATVNLTTPPPFAIVGTAIFTAANGDEFYTSFTGTNTPTGIGTSRGIINHVITGGTGRFADASGSFTGIAIVNQANPTNTVTFEGSINY